MATEHTEQRAADDKSENDVDKAVEDSFPASDPPATGGVTKIGSEDENLASGEQPDSDVPGTGPEEDVPNGDTPAEQPPGEAPPDKEAPGDNALK